MSDSPVAIVTGGAQGLGAAIVLLLLKKGYKVTIADIQKDGGKQMLKELKNIYGAKNVMFAVCDVTKEADYKNVFEVTLNEFGRIDLLINNAGILSEENYRKCVEVNLIGPVIGCQMAFQYMGRSNGGKGGTVINTASLAGLRPGILPIYSATKHGVIGLTRAYGLPHCFTRDGIIFAALCPAIFESEMKKTGAKLYDRMRDKVKELKDYILSPEFVAEGVSKLLEDKINGSTLLISKENGYQYINVPEELMSLIN